MKTATREQVVSTRLTGRVYERLTKVAASKGLRVGEFIRIATLREVERAEREGRNGA